MAIPFQAIGAGAGILGSLLGTLTMGRRIRAARAAQDQATANALALGRNVLAQQQAAFSPFLQRGNQAGAYINALLGLPATGGGGAVSATPAGPSEEEQLAFLRSTADGKTGKRIRRANSLSEALGYADAGERARFESYMASRAPLPDPYGGAGDAAVSQPDAEEAFNTFLNSTNYQFTRDEALRAAAQPFFSRGVGQSGAAIRAQQELASNLGRNAIGSYLAALGGQQGVGFSAAGSLANAAGNYGQTGQALATQQGNNQAQAALARGVNAQDAIMGGVQGLNLLLGSSFGNRAGGAAPVNDIVMSRMAGSPSLRWGG